MDTYEQWAAVHPAAARDLELMCRALPEPGGDTGASESQVQQQIRFAAAREGAMAWRNNVGATPARCPDCGAPRQPVRYGLANDSPQLNARIKSADLILAIPRVITRADVGRTIAQFGSVEAKDSGWKFTGRGREAAQMQWAALIRSLGGYAVFSTGELQL